eukprot:918483_1
MTMVSLQVKDPEKKRNRQKISLNYPRNRRYPSMKASEILNQTPKSEGSDTIPALSRPRTRLQTDSLRTSPLRSLKRKRTTVTPVESDDDDVSPSKRLRKEAKSPENKSELSTKPEATGNSPPLKQQPSLKSPNNVSRSQKSTTPTAKCPATSSSSSANQDENADSGRKKLSKRRASSQCVNEPAAKKHKSHFESLISAALHGDLEDVKYVISLDATDVNSTGRQGMNVLHIAAARGHLKMVHYLLTYAKIDVGSTANFGM